MQEKFDNTVGHLEKGESGVEIVAVEKLVPGLDTDGLNNKAYADAFRKWVKEERKHGMIAGHRDQYVPYADELGNFFGYIVENPEQNSRSLDIFKRLQNQIVVDLGAGSYGRDVYSVVSEMGAAGYIGVDLWHSEALKSNLKEKTAGFEFKPEKPQGSIPAAVVGEDILRFLKRLPDKSVSIIATGLHEGFLPKQYQIAVKQEIERVLDPKGVMISDQSLYINAINLTLKVPKEASVRKYEFDVFINLTREQRLQRMQILDEFKREIQGLGKEDLKNLRKNIEKELSRKGSLIEEKRGVQNAEEELSVQLQIENLKEKFCLLNTK